MIQPFSITFEPKRILISVVSFLWNYFAAFFSFFCRCFGSVWVLEFFYSKKIRPVYECDFFCYLLLSLSFLFFIMYILLKPYIYFSFFVGATVVVAVAAVAAASAIRSM